MRNKLCEPQNLPIYIVAGSKTLFEMSEYLPQTEKELLEINGFGAAKVEKYGQSFLSIIKDYCQKHNLSSRMEQKESKRKKKEKKPVGETYRMTLDMYKSGKNIEEIAKERSLAISTIGTHLARYVQAGEIPITDFVSSEQCAQVKKILKAMEENVSVYQTLREHFSNIETSMILAWIRGKNESNAIQIDE